jgi:hypothetical protein
MGLHPAFSKLIEQARADFDLELARVRLEFERELSQLRIEFESMRQEFRSQLYRLRAIEDFRQTNSDDEPMWFN